jgi:hypothetical protein
MAFAEQKVNWNLIAKKANGWVTKEAAKLGVSTNFEDIAATFLASQKL